MIFVEKQYSIYLSSSILKLYGYNENNFTYFFKGIGEKKYCPILIWEYIILRTQLLLNLDKIIFNGLF